MVSLMSGGMYHSLFQLFTTKDIIIAGVTLIGISYIYVKAHLKIIKDKKIEREFKKLELNKKIEAVDGIQNVDILNLF